MDKGLPVGADAGHQRPSGGIGTRLAVRTDEEQSNRDDGPYLDGVLVAHLYLIVRIAVCLKESLERFPPFRLVVAVVGRKCRVPLS